jgi:hypothetical protein
LACVESVSRCTCARLTWPPREKEDARRIASVYEKLDLANRYCGGSVLRVSATEIIQELPKLSPAERRTVRRVLSDLAAKEEDVQLCNQVATEAAMIFDRMEEEDARRQQG